MCELDKRGRAHARWRLNLERERARRFLLSPPRCKACKSIEPKFKRLAVEFGDVAGFYEIEFNANKALCRRLEIKKLPVVQFYRTRSQSPDAARFQQKTSLESFLAKTPRFGAPSQVAPRAASRP